MMSGRSLVELLTDAGWSREQFINDGPSPPYVRVGMSFLPYAATFEPSRLVDRLLRRKLIFQVRDFILRRKITIDFETQLELRSSGYVKDFDNFPFNKPLLVFRCDPHSFLARSDEGIFEIEYPAFIAAKGIRISNG